MKREWDKREWVMSRVMCGYGLSMVQDIRKRIGQTVIYGESRYTKRNGLDGWVSIVWVETSVSMAKRSKERE